MVKASQLIREKHSIPLPELKEYQQQFNANGVKTPLKTVPFSPTGLLEKLPAPPSRKTGWPWTIETKPLAGTMPNGLHWPKITIVTPSYNQGSFIEETIRSVLLQNYPNLEYIVCDGGSTDETTRILEKYSPWLSYWHSKKDRGQGHAINLGFSLANGEYYSWINSDDYYTPNCFQAVASHFLQSRREFIYGDAIVLNDTQQTIRYRKNQLVLDRYLRFGGIIAQPASFWKSDIHKPIWEELNCAIDAELWLRLVPGKSRLHLHYPLAIVRVQPEAKTRHERYQTLWQQDYQEKIWKAYRPLKSWKYVNKEFRVVQSLYHKLFKDMSSESVRSLLHTSLKVL